MTNTVKVTELDLMDSVRAGGGPEAQRTALAEAWSSVASTHAGHPATQTPAPAHTNPHRNDEMKYIWNGNQPTHLSTVGPEPRPGLRPTCDNLGSGTAPWRGLTHLSRSCFLVRL